MNDFTEWRILKNGAKNDFVLAVDFYSPGRSEATFSDLAPALSVPSTVWETMQPEPGTEENMTGDDYLNRWLDALPDGEIRGVLGFCVGGVYASALARRIGERRGKQPAVVMFDPEPVSSIVLYWQFHKLLDKLVGVLTPQEIEESKASGFAEAEGADDLVVLGDSLIKLYREVGHVGLGRLGLNESRRNEMMSWFDAYVHYLVGATQVETAADLSTCTVINSDAPADGRHLAGAELSFDLDRHDLLRRSAVAEAVSGLLK
ncbi:hypothetical protein ACIOD2_24045 [Amycolatopsis sp. NPDC088138]|uniref:hypothetical protein n=1 Tax=Amycolatopsis sp. NPDC088138 TaxID=3363938 RepID=UPI003825DC5A